MLEFDFVVAGLKYSTKKLPVDFELGTIVVLYPEIANQHDQNAISLWVNGQKIGYVPNKGEYCSKCLNRIVNGSWYCKCGASSEEFLSGGMASKIHESGILAKEHRAFINRVDDRRILIKLMGIGVEND